MTDLVKEKVYLDNLDGQLSEVISYSKFANQAKQMLLNLYNAGFDIPLSLIGSSKQIDSFMTSLKGEKRYMDSYMKHGLSDPRTIRTQRKLNTSVGKFEKETGLRWPFKN